MYDSFESDPALIERLRVESASVRALTTRAIKDEMEQMKLTTSHIFDRDELVRKLAIARIKVMTTQSHSYAQRQADAAMLMEEIEKVSVLTDEDVIRRLQMHYVHIADIIDRNELDRKLAMINIGLGPPPTQPAPSESPSSGSNTIESDVRFGGNMLRDVEKMGLLEGIQGVSRRLRDSLQEPVANVKNEVGSIGKAFSETTSRMSKVIPTDIAYTRSEMRARNVIEGRCDAGDAGAGGSATSAQNATATGGQELQRLWAKALQFNTFDDIHDWALAQPRSILVLLLKHHQIGVPKYAPRSTLADIMADSVMMEKNVPATNADGQKENFYYAPADAIDAVRGSSEGGGHKSSSSSSSSSRQTGRGLSSKARLRPKDSFSSYEPEKELLEALASKTRKLMTATIPRLWSQVANYENVQTMIRASVRLVLKSPLVAVLLSFINLASTAGNDLATRMAAWAGGKSLAPSQSLFLASLFCILFRRGLLSFMGVLAFIRLVRILFAEKDDNAQSEGSLPPTFATL